MDDFQAAIEIYHEGRQLYELTNELAVTWFDLRIDREDLDEALLDLKLAVLDRDAPRVRRYVYEVKHLMAGIYLKLANR
jgi:hypothetical protein